MKPYEERCAGTYTERRYLDSIAWAEERYLSGQPDDTGLFLTLSFPKPDMAMHPNVTGRPLTAYLQAFAAGMEDVETLAGYCAPLFSWLAGLEPCICFSEQMFNGVLVFQEGRPCMTVFDGWRLAPREGAFAELLARICLACTAGQGDDTESVTRADTLLKVLAVCCADRYGIDQSGLLLTVREKQAALRAQQEAMSRLKGATAVLLCGGQSSRMNGSPKQLLRIENFTFWEHILHTLMCFDDILLSVNEENDRGTFIERCREHTSGRLRLIADTVGSIGPLGGLHASLCSAGSGPVFAVSCDIPKLSRELICFLFECWLDSYDCLIPVVQGRVHPLCGIYSPRMLPAVEAQIQVSTPTRKCGFSPKWNVIFRRSA